MNKIFEKWRRSISQKIQSAIHANRERAHIGVLDTVENRTRLPSVLGQTLHRTMQESSLVMGMGGT